MTTAVLLRVHRARHPARRPLARFPVQPLRLAPRHARLLNLYASPCASPHARSDPSARLSVSLSPSQRVSRRPRLLSLPPRPQALHRLPMSNVNLKRRQKWTETSESQSSSKSRKTGRLTASVKQFVSAAPSAGCLRLNERFLPSFCSLQPGCLPAASDQARRRDTVTASSKPLHVRPVLRIRIFAPSRLVKPALRLRFLNVQAECTGTLLPSPAAIQRRYGKRWSYRFANTSRF